jgi:hypothetical protein
MKHIKYLRSINACPGAIHFASRYKTLLQAWKACEEIDWMIWLLEKTEYPGVIKLTNEVMKRYGYVHKARKPDLWIDVLGLPERACKDIRELVPNSYIRGLS